MYIDIYRSARRWSDDGLHMLLDPTRSVGRTSLTTILGTGTRILLKQLRLKRLHLSLHSEHLLLHLLKISFHFILEAFGF